MAGRSPGCSARALAIRLTCSGGIADWVCHPHHPIDDSGASFYLHRRGDQVAVGQNETSLVPAGELQPSDGPRFGCVSRVTTAGSGIPHLRQSGECTGRADSELPRKPAPNHNTVGVCKVVAACFVPSFIKVKSLRGCCKQLFGYPSSFFCASLFYVEGIAWNAVKTHERGPDGSWY